MRPRLLGVKKDVFALEYEHTREFDTKYKNRFGIYLKSSGELIGVIRLNNGDKNEL